MTALAPAPEHEPFTHSKSGEAREVVLETGPASPPTHWMQSIFYLQREFTVAPGDVIEGTIACKVNPHDTRALDVGFELVFQLEENAASAATATESQEEEGAAISRLHEEFCFRTELRY